MKVLAHLLVLTDVSGKQHAFVLFDMSDLHNLLVCDLCGNPLTPPQGDSGKCFCPQGHFKTVADGVIHYHGDELLSRYSEAAVRDRQAPGYLQHGKLPSQIAHIRRFVEAIPAELKKYPALDLGCGPGPTTAICLEQGIDVVAVDFSARSLHLNKLHRPAGKAESLYVLADLKKVRFADRSAGVLMMCDFLQHLMQDAEPFLERVFDALIPGGVFYLSAFNFNLVHRWKGDRTGSFSQGNIPYRRFSLPELAQMLPKGVEIEKTYAMNIFTNPGLDRIACSAPGSSLLARWIILQGRRVR